MFALHETTQRRVCRIVFLALCVIPTFLTLAAVAYCNRPWRSRDWQQSLASQLHVRAELDDITRPRPGQTVLSALRLADLESDEFFCSSERLQFHHRDGRLILEVDHLKIPATRLSDLWSAVSTWLATDTSSTIEANLEQLTIAHETFADWQLKNVTIRADQNVDGTHRVVFSGDHLTNAKLKAGLIASSGKLTGKIEATQTPLPAWLVGQFIPGIQSCGPSEFSGSIVVEQDRRQQTGKLQGNFAAVDLQQWIGQNCPHRLQGLAALAFEELTWTAGRINTARGSLRVGSGAMSYSLFDNAQQLCGWVAGPAWDTPIPSPSDALIAFDEATLSFRLNPDGIAFAGQGDEGAIMAKDQAPLVSLQQSEITLPVGQLVRLLNYLEQPSWMPATRSAHDMADSLPLPGDEVGTEVNER